MCFTAYNVRSIDKLLGRTTGRLEDIRPDTAYAIGGTAELALQYSTDLRILRPDYGQAGAAGAWATPQHPPGAAGQLT